MVGLMMFLIAFGTTAWIFVWSLTRDGRDEENAKDLALFAICSDETYERRFGDRFPF